jgi:hypothetical protein
MAEHRLARDPLAELLPPSLAVASSPPGQVAPERSADGDPAQRPSAGRDRITVQVERELAEQVRDAVMWLHRVGVHTTISAIAAAGLRNELGRLASLHNDGRPFPPRRGDVPIGRPPRA